MLTALDELCARMAVLENLQRELLSNSLAWCTEAESEVYKKKLIGQMKNPAPSSGPMNTAREQKEAEIRDRSVEYMKDFIEDCSRREAESRKQLEQFRRR